METPVVVALISSGTSVAIAMWSLMTARIAKALALEAEELAKRSEHVRVKALDAGEALLKSLAEFMIATQTAIQLMEMRGGRLLEEDVPTTLQPANKAYSAMRRCVLENAVYLTDDISSDVSAVVSQPNLNPEDLPGSLEEARKLHDSLVSMFRRVYLWGATVRSHNLALQLTAGEAGRR